eukprot:5531202-Lingulodinium_polyedra.AAC.1
MCIRDSGERDPAEGQARRPEPPPGRARHGARVREQLCVGVGATRPSATATLRRARSRGARTP